MRRPDNTHAPRRPGPILPGRVQNIPSEARRRERDEFQTQDRTELSWKRHANQSDNIALNHPRVGAP